MIRTPLSVAAWTAPRRLAAEATPLHAATGPPCAAAATTSFPTPSTVLNSCPTAGTGEERFHRVNGLRTFSRVMGEGPEVVLVHGAGVSSAYWKPAQRLLACREGFRVHALDLPGFGRSQDAPWPPELSRLTDHLL